MTTRALAVVALLSLGSACAPSLHLTRPTPPEGDFGPVRTMSLDVATDMGQAVENSVVGGLLMGQIPIPVPVHAAVRQALQRRLIAQGYGVCPAAPCGDGAMTVRLTESSVNGEMTTSGMRAHVRVRARVVVKAADGSEPYDFSFWANRSGSADQAPRLVLDASEAIASRFEQTLIPGRQSSTLPLEDGGPLSPGVNMLLSSNWDGAISYFTQLTQQQPELAGAWYDLGVAWEARGDWGQALAAYEQAAARDRKRTYRDAAAAARRMAPAPAATPTPVQPIPVQ